MDPETIVIVSGLPRSGTSMTMKMLEAGGMELLTDGIRAADEDNPKGYYEFEQVKRIEHDKSWLPAARGKAVKMISALLHHLPPDYSYKVIFMQRAMPEVLASQRQMLIRRGQDPDKISDERMADLFSKHLEQVEAWLAQQPHFETLYISYNDMLVDPELYARRIDAFLGGGLDVERMVGVVDSDLYRQRREKLE